MHQSFKDGLVVCADPATMHTKAGRALLTLIRRTPDGFPIWGKYNEGPNPFSTPQKPSGDESERVLALA
jgi:hypothetical protein